VLPRLIVAAVVVAAFAWFGQVLLLLFGGILFALLLDSLTGLLGRVTGLTRRWRFAIVLTVLVIVIAGGLYLLGDMIVQQVTALIEQVPRIIEDWREKLEKTSWGHMVLEPAGDVGKTDGGMLTDMTVVVAGILGALGTTFLVFMTGVFFAAEPKVYKNGALWLLPDRHRERAGEMQRDITETLRWWILGKSLSMLVVAILSLIGLLLLGVPHAFTLALIAGATAFIPTIGPIIAVVPAALVALAEEPMLAVWVIALYAGIQVVESYLVTPMIQERTVEVPAGLILAAQLLAGFTLGALGLLFATPLLVVVIALVRSLRADGETAAGDETG
jgi:predicted PurR-regulated permease PerM